LITNFGICCITSCCYRGGINMRGSSLDHLNDPIGGLNGGPLGGSPLGAFPLGESLFVVLHPMVDEHNLWVHEMVN
jgi:hypothetical protein